ncbi:MAG: hypothetical protein C0478_05880 [Planctomyces sp.]|jgi:hypothetical protein|nr:hypothetical protein [Planctomyces sp.]
MTAFSSTANDRQTRTLERMMKWLERMGERDQQLYGAVRQFERKSFHAGVIVCVPTPEHPFASCDHPTACSAVAFNISQGGVGLVSSQEFSHPTVQIGLKLPDGSYRWKEGRVVRVREIPGESFVEYGISFRKATEPSAG